MHTIIDETGLRQWKFHTSPLASPSFSGMSELTNGDVLILERDFNDHKKEFSLALSRLKLESCDPDSICKPEVLLLTNSSEHPALGAFEGIAKLSDTEFLIISDNSKSEVHQTLLSKIKLN